LLDIRQHQHHVLFISSIEQRRHIIDEYRLKRDVARTYEKTYKRCCQDVQVSEPYCVFHDNCSSLVCRCLAFRRFHLETKAMVRCHG
jgi:hypothetical protein